MAALEVKHKKSLEDKEKEANSLKDEMNRQIEEYSEAIGILENQIELREKEIKAFKTKLEVANIERVRERENLQIKYEEELEELRLDLEETSKRLEVYHLK
jgi:hypothetical protein